MSHSTDQRRRPCDWPGARKRQDLSALAQAVAQRTPQVDACAGGVRSVPTGTAQIQRHHQSADFRLRVLDLGSAHGFEIHRLQTFPLGHCEHGVQLWRLLAGRLSRLARRRHRLCNAASGGRRLLAGLFLSGFHQRHRRCLLMRRGIAPEQRERVVENLSMVVAVDHRGGQRGPRLGFVADIDTGQRLLGGQRLGRTHWQSGAA